MKGFRLQILYFQKQNFRKAKFKGWGIQFNSVEYSNSILFTHSYNREAMTASLMRSSCV